VVPSVHFLIRQAAREKLAAARTLSREAKARHHAMANLYLSRAEQLQAAPQNEDAHQPIVVRRKQAASR